jgi:pilus assembly protein CpaE
MNSIAESEAHSGVPVALAIRDKALREQVLEAIQSLPAMVLDQDCPLTSQEELLASVARLRPGIVLLGLSGLPGDASEAMARMASLDPAPLIIAVNATADPASILKAMRSGAAEFVYPPFDGAFSEAFRRVAADCLKKSTAAGTAEGRIIGFVSAKGGCGATTLACHSADYLHRSRRKHVLLADLDLSSGMAGLLLQITPHYSLADALQNLHRLDFTLWKGLVSTAASGLEVIPAPPAPFDPGTAARSLSHLLRFWRSQYDLTVLDLGLGFTPLLAGLVEWIDVLAVVTTNELPALRQAKLLVQGLTQRNYGTRRVRLVINRMPKRTEIQVPELERIMGFPIQTALPNDYRSLAEAYAQPKLLESTSFLGKHIANMAAALAEIAPEPMKKSRRLWI